MTKSTKGPGRPKLPAAERRIPVKFRLHPKTAARLAEHSRRENLSMGKLVGQLIDDKPLAKVPLK